MAKKKWTTPKVVVATGLVAFTVKVALPIDAAQAMDPERKPSMEDMMTTTASSTSGYGYTTTFSVPSWLNPQKVEPFEPAPDYVALDIGDTGVVKIPAALIKKWREQS